MRDIDPNDPIYKNLTRLELQNMKFISREDKEIISMRIFGESLYGPPSWEKQRDQRWKTLLGEVSSRGIPYRITHQDLMQKIARAERLRSKEKGVGGNHVSRPHTVSDFTDWLYRFYTPPRDDKVLLAGIDGERAVVDHREQIKREVPRLGYERWKLKHDGIRRKFDEAFLIPSLTVDGLAIKGVPDLVFKERRTGRILIVELKVSSKDLPSNGWPNLRAQLWAYSRIEQYAAAPEVLLAGEVWSHQLDKPVLRQTYFWRRGDLQLEEECTELFLAYGGRVTASS